MGVSGASLGGILGGLDLPQGVPQGAVAHRVGECVELGVGVEVCVDPRGYRGARVAELPRDREQRDAACEGKCGRGVPEAVERDRRLVLTRGEAGAEEYALEVLPRAPLAEGLSRAAWPYVSVSRGAALDYLLAEIRSELCSQTPG